LQLFENLGCAIELHEKLADEITELHYLDPRKYLFNGIEKGNDCNDFLFGQGIINEASSDWWQGLFTALWIAVFVCIQRVLQKSACNLDELSLRT
jgi:hypothetical protein